eukprot:Nk52_evm38s1737 gene=Nk52_evmTU38s1737
MLEEVKANSVGGKIPDNCECPKESVETKYIEKSLEKLTLARHPSNSVHLKRKAALNNHHRSGQLHHQKIQCANLHYKSHRVKDKHITHRSGMLKSGSEDSCGSDRTCGSSASSDQHQKYSDLSSLLSKPSLYALHREIQIILELYLRLGLLPEEDVRDLTDKFNRRSKNVKYVKKLRKKLMNNRNENFIKYSNLYLQWWKSAFSSSSIDVIGAIIRDIHAFVPCTNTGLDWSPAHTPVTKRKSTASKIGRKLNIFSFSASSSPEKKSKESDEDEPLPGKKSTEKLCCCSEPPVVCRNEKNAVVC